MKRRFLPLTALTAMAVIACLACTKEIKTMSGDIAGSWGLIEVRTSEGVTDARNLAVTMTFNTDGTFVAKKGSEEKPGVWRMNDGSLFMRFSGGGKEEQSRLDELSVNRLSYSSIITGGKIMTNVFQRLP